MLPPICDPVSPGTLHSMTRGVTPVARGVTPVTRGVTPVTRGVTPVTRGVTPVTRGVTPMTDCHSADKLPCRHLVVVI